MKISFNFDTTQRSFSMSPEDNLELVLMDHLTELCEKGATLRVTKTEFQTPEVRPLFRVEMRLNGKTT